MDVAWFYIKHYICYVCFFFYLLYKTQSTKKLQNVSLGIACSIGMGFQNANENEFHGFGNLVI